MSQEVSDFKAYAPLQPVSETDYYRIQIPPKIIPFVNRNFSDLRIYSETGEEVPYFIQKKKEPKLNVTFKSYTILQNESNEEKTTTLVLHNKDKEEINEVHFRIKNADVEKRAWFLGSDDNELFYVIKDNFNLHSLNTVDETTIMKVMNFPKVDYEFIKLVISDSLSAPVKILDAGFYDYSYLSKVYQQVPVLHFSQIDSTDKKTYLEMVFDDRQLIDKLSFTVEGAEYYYRNAKLVRKKVKKIKKRKSQVYVETILQFKLNSSQSNGFTMNSIPADTIYLIIDNFDDQPLIINEVNAFQKINYIYTKLEANKKYKLAFGKADIGFPKYDITYFKDSISESLDFVKIDEIVVVEKSIKSKSEGMAKKWIWLFLIVVLAFLLYMSFKMIKDMKKNNQDK